MLEFLINHWQAIFTTMVFVAVFLTIIFEWFDKAVVAIIGAVLLLITRVITFEQAVESINFEIIFLLAAMMIIVEIARESGLFTWANFKLAKYSKGSPFKIFLFFTLITAISSAFLDNVTTVLIIVPLTIALVNGMGYNPFPFVLGEIMFSNIGGALTLVGDPPNILVGTMVGIPFISFITHLWIPILAIMATTLMAFYVIKWKDLKPINHHLPKLFLGNLLLERLKYQFTKTNLNKKYMVTVSIVLGLTIVGFLLQLVIGLPLAVIALVSAFLLMLIVHKKIHVHHVFSKIEWPTLAFFAGLFILVHGLEAVGLLDIIAHYLTNITSNCSILLMIILWSAGLFSMVVDNIPFVTVMIPVLMTIETSFAGNPHVSLIWWALILGAALGGNGTIVGASANVIGTDLARQQGVKITFLSYFKYSFPLTIMALTISSAYLLVWYFYF